MMESLGTQLAGHFHVRVWGLDSGVWRWYGNQRAPSGCRGTGGGFRSRRLRSLQVTDRKRNLCCCWSSAVPCVHLNLTFSNVNLSTGWIVLKSCCSWERLAFWEGTGHRDSQQTGSHRDGRGVGLSLDHPLVWMPHLFWGCLPSPERVYLNSVTSVNIKMAEQQETDWAPFFLLFLPYRL